jgi:hypothetical protein
MQELAPVGSDQRWKGWKKASKALRFFCSKWL